MDVVYCNQVTFIPSFGLVKCTNSSSIKKLWVVHDSGKQCFELVIKHAYGKLEKTHYYMEALQTTWAFYKVNNNQIANL